VGLVGGPSFAVGPTTRSRSPEGRVGVVVPPANPTVESELRDLLDHDLVVTRFRPVDGDLRARLDDYGRQLHERIDDFAGLPLDALYVACTGCFYDRRPPDVERLSTELSARWGMPVVLPVTAITAALAVIGASRLVLVSPYPDWLTAASVEYWRRAGFDVPVVVRVGGGDPYEVTTDDVVDAVRSQGLADAGCVVFTGTGMRTLAAMRRLADKLGVPMLSSNWASAWQLGEAVAAQAVPYRTRRGRQR
jgi:maleate isomerase